MKKTKEVLLQENNQLKVLVAKLETELRVIKGYNEDLQKLLRVLESVEHLNIAAHVITDAAAHVVTAVVPKGGIIYRRDQG